LRIAGHYQRLAGQVCGIVSSELRESLPNDPPYALPAASVCASGAGAAASVDAETADGASGADGAGAVAAAAAGAGVGAGPAALGTGIALG
jgi:hypothetical protein